MHILRVCTIYTPTKWNRVNDTKMVFDVVHIIHTMILLAISLFLFLLFFSFISGNISIKFNRKTRANALYICVCVCVTEIYFFFFFSETIRGFLNTFHIHTFHTILVLNNRFRSIDKSRLRFVVVTHEYAYALYYSPTTMCNVHIYMGFFHSPTCMQHVIH